MCGIVGCVGKNAGRVVLQKLNMLQYRGYDSAGIGVSDNGALRVCKCVGSVENLYSLCDEQLLSSQCAIGHTRWATHGKVCEENAHPCCAGKVALVHNGIFENSFAIGKTMLNEALPSLDSLIFTKCFNKLLHTEEGNSDEISFILGKLLTKFRGSWALCSLIKGCPNTIFFAKYKSPLVVGKSENYMILSSDSSSISDRCGFICELNDGDFGWVSDKNLRVYNKFCKESDVKWNKTSQNLDNISLGSYACFMEKEIDEGAQSVLATFDAKNLGNLAWVSNMKNVPSFFMCACGSAFNAGLCLKYWMRKYLNKPLECIYSSEYSKEEAKVGIFVSQSGETADTIRCVDMAKERGVVTVGIINTENSTLTKMCDFTIMTKAGKECAVAATKTYLAQLAGLLAFVKLSSKNEELSFKIDKLCAKLKNIDWNKVKIEVKKIAQIIKNESSVYFVGRGLDYYIAKEAALKLKEVSYIHVEAFPAGELKHGSLALIESGTIVIVVLTQTNLIKKTMNNVAEIKSRGGKIVLFSPFYECADSADYFIQVPYVDDDFSPFVLATPFQLLACYTALAKGINPDFPRNLAKSVTVE